MDDLHHFTKTEVRLFDRISTLEAQLAERDGEIEGLRRVGEEMYRTLALLMPPADDATEGAGPDWRRILDGSAPTADEESNAKPATGEGEG